jgi:hypothetical protein
MTTPESVELPSSRKLFRATAIAILAAAIILVTVVLPAEYGLDPLGVGRRLGLFRPHAAPAPEAAAAVSDGMPSAGGLFKSETPFRSDEMTVELAPGEGAEVKAAMKQGERFVFSWVAVGGAVDVDMHGEALGAADDDYSSYWKDASRSSGHGAFEAAVTGRHGWFWQNLGSSPVTVTVKTSGFYEKLFRP